jgi:hypothetical protein
MIVLCLAAIIYLVSLTIPRISDEDINALKNEKDKKILRFVEISDFLFKLSMEKFLRKLKIWILSFNNFIEKTLNNIKKDLSKKEINIEQGENIGGENISGGNKKEEENN